MRIWNNCTFICPGGIGADTQETFNRFHSTNCNENPTGVWPNNLKLIFFCVCVCVCVSLSSLHLTGSLSNLCRVTDAFTDLECILCFISWQHILTIDCNIYWKRLFVHCIMAQNYEMMNKCWDVWDLGPVLWFQFIWFAGRTPSRRPGYRTLFWSCETIVLRSTPRAVAYCYREQAIGIKGTALSWFKTQMD